MLDEMEVMILAYILEVEKHLRKMLKNIKRYTFVRYCFWYE